MLLKVWVVGSDTRGQRDSDRVDMIPNICINLSWFYPHSLMLLLFRRLYSMAIAWFVGYAAWLIVACICATALWNRIGAVQTAAPFLFPCTIEYSLICAVILFEMWKHISSDKKHHVQELKSHKDSHQLSINCAGSNRGMFGGILVSINACVFIFN